MAEKRAMESSSNDTNAEEVSESGELPNRLPAKPSSDSENSVAKESSPASGTSAPDASATAVVSPKRHDDACVLSDADNTPPKRNRMSSGSEEPSPAGDTSTAYASSTAIVSRRQRSRPFASPDRTNACVLSDADDTPPKRSRMLFGSEESSPASGTSAPDALATAVVSPKRHDDACVLSDADNTPPKRNRMSSGSEVKRSIADKRTSESSSGDTTEEELSERGEVSTRSPASPSSGSESCDAQVEVKQRMADKRTMESSSKDTTEEVVSESGKVPNHLPAKPSSDSENSDAKEPSQAGGTSTGDVSSTAVGSPRHSDDACVLSDADNTPPKRSRMISGSESDVSSSSDLDTSPESSKYHGKCLVCRRPTSGACRKCKEDFPYVTCHRCLLVVQNCTCARCQLVTVHSLLNCPRSPVALWTIPLKRDENKESSANGTPSTSCIFADVILPPSPASLCSSEEAASTAQISSPDPSDSPSTSLPNNTTAAESPSLPPFRPRSTRIYSRPPGFRPVIRRATSPGYSASSYSSSDDSATTTHVPRAFSSSDGPSCMYFASSSSTASGSPPASLSPDRRTIYISQPPPGPPAYLLRQSRSAAAANALSLPTAFFPAPIPPPAPLVVIRPPPPMRWGRRFIGVSGAMLHRSLEHVFDTVQQTVLSSARELSRNLLNAPELQDWWPEEPQPRPLRRMVEITAADLHTEISNLLQINDPRSPAFPQPLWMPDNAWSILQDTPTSRNSEISSQSVSSGRNIPTFDWRKPANKLLKYWPMEFLEEFDERLRTNVKIRCSQEVPWVDPQADSVMDSVIYSRWENFQFLGLYDWYRDETWRYNNDQEHLYERQVDRALFRNDAAIESMDYLMFALDDFSVDYDYRVSSEIHKLRYKRFCRRMDLHWSMLQNTPVTLDLALTLSKVEDAFLVGATRARSQLVFLEPTGPILHRPYLCTYCGVGFRGVEDLMDHMYMIHEVIVKYY